MCGCFETTNVGKVLDTPKPEEYTPDRTGLGRNVQNAALEQTKIPKALGERVTKHIYRVFIPLSSVDSQETWQDYKKKLQANKARTKGYGKPYLLEVTGFTRPGINKYEDYEI